MQMALTAGMFVVMQSAVNAKRSNSSAHKPFEGLLGTFPVDLHYHSGALETAS